MTWSGWFAVHPIPIEAKTMNIFQSFGNAIQYLAEGVARFFDKNDYPEIGVQPFSGDYYSEVNFKQIEK